MSGVHEKSVRTRQIVEAEEISLSGPNVVRESGVEATVNGEPSSGLT